MELALTALQLCLAAGNLIVMIYALTKFISKPRDNINTRLTALEAKVLKVEEQLKQGNDRFREQYASNEIITKSVMALIEFEMQYCLTEKKPVSDSLKRAKEDLDSFLTKKYKDIED